MLTPDLIAFVEKFKLVAGEYELDGDQMIRHKTKLISSRIGNAWAACPLQAMTSVADPSDYHLMAKQLGLDTPCYVIGAADQHKFNSGFQVEAIRHELREAMLKAMKEASAS